ncbi:MAG TPA: low specificity L-threonine aldolase [Candidatus Binatia bacterium]|nr:low specificity L-threonine aldolase [Candidatus Binatia bacterium]
MSRILDHSAATRPRHFASDNYSGVCPEAWAALEQANAGHAPSYGEDAWTRRASDLLREMFETDCEIFFVFNGTAANSLALATCCQSYHSILCSDIAHVETDECGAPEFFSNGTKVQLLPSCKGRITPDAVEREATRRSDIHFPRPRVLSVTQGTEVGTVYTVQQLGEISDMARRFGLKLHMDGARLANAVAFLGCAPREITWQAGVDVLCLGGTKNGMAVGDAVVFFDKALAVEFEWRCKQAGQLSSKMRYLSAPWVGMLADGAWLRHARHANAMAQLLSQRLSRIDGVTLQFETQANGVFAELPKMVIESLWARGWLFYTFIGPGGCRFVCSWDTRPQDVEDLAADVAELMGAA